MAVEQKDVERARFLAEASHFNQQYAGQPYVTHLDAVAAIVQPYGLDAMLVAYMHDVLEDTGMTFEDIMAEFGPKVALDVQLCTDEPGANRKERKAKSNIKFSMANEVMHANALIVKAADRLANVRQTLEEDNRGLFKMYWREHPEFQISVWRAGLCDPLWADLNRLIALGRVRYNLVATNSAG